MLLNLKLTNFRKVTSDEMTFADGINVIRGMNEASKSTRIEAISYALFGSKALRTSLDDAVTWNEPVNTLKVELTLAVQGETMIFKRSKAGAEVIKSGKVFCTGQNEVSALAAQLLGADAATAAKLLVANQNSIRGALEEGPKALSVMIENLSGMEVFDQILDAAQHKLALGSPALLEERLKGAEATREAATQNLPPKPDQGAFDTKMGALEAQIKTLTGSLPALQAKAEDAKAKWIEAATEYGKRAPLERAIEEASIKLEEARKQVAIHAPAARKTVDMSMIPVLKAQIAEAEGYDQRVVAHRLFRNLPDVIRYVGTKEAFEAETERLQIEVKGLTASVVVTERAIAAARNRRIDHDKCDKCGQDITHLAHVKETNTAVDAELAMLIPQLEEQQKALTATESREIQLSLIRKSDRDVSATLSKLGNFCEIDTSVFPAKAAWIGEVPGDAPDTATLKRKLQAIEDEVKFVEQAQTKLEMAQGMVAKAEAEVAAAKKALADFVCPSPETVVALSEAKDKAEVEWRGAEGSIYLAKAEAESLTKEFSTASQLWTMAQSRIEDADKVIAECRKDLGLLAFNNALVKKLRAIRPVIADKLWATVLSSVSVMFSQMRKVESWVSKDKDGFKVNGQSVESLSGSTLDLLGLAIRATLVKTFLPSCGLLVLDEPGAACDIERTESLLGFIAGAGFTQTLLVTHDEISDAVADHIITL